MKKKKPYQYMKVAGTEEFPVTKKRQEFKLPWRVNGKGLSGNWFNLTAKRTYTGGEND